MKVRSSLGALLALVVAAGVAGCRSKEEVAAVVAPPVLVAPAEAQRVEDRIEATGELRAQNAAAVAAQVGGQVTKLVRDEGAAVGSDEVVIEIDPELRKLELDNARALAAQAEAQAGEAGRELSRMEKLHAEGVAADAKVDQMRTQIVTARGARDAAQAQLGMAERAMRNASVKAPFAGLVARRYVSQGEFVQPGQKLFDLVALDPIEVEFHLPERDSSKVAQGASVGVRVAPFPDEVFAAQVSLVSPTIDPQTRTLRVKAILANPDGRLRPGLFARADLGISTRDHVVMIPEDAVLQRADGAIAYRLVPQNRVERRKLTLGIFQGGKVEVVDGLAAGDLVVIRGQDQLTDGITVSIRDESGAASPSGAVTSGPRTASAEPKP
jgi:membrane fusion protein (multidrug efflux system)